MKIFFSTLSLLCILGLLPLHATETLAETIDALPVTNYYKITAITGQINATVREAWDDATLISRVQCRVTYSIFHTSTKKQETRYATQTWQISVKDSGEHLFQLSDFKKVAVLGKIVFQCVPVFKSEDTTGATIELYAQLRFDGKDDDKLSKDWNEQTATAPVVLADLQAQGWTLIKVAEVHIPAKTAKN